MKYLNRDNSIIKPKIRIIGLCALSAYELVLLIIMLVAANAVGFGTYVVDKGLVATVSTPLLLVLFLLALIYEIRRFWGKSRNRWGRYALCAIAAVLIVGSTVWYAFHSPVGGKQLLTPMRQYAGDLSAPLLADISPDENAELEAWIEKDPAENDGHVVYNKSDLAAEIISTQQDVPPFAGPREGFAVQENYYSTKLYSDCASERVVRLLVNAWDYPTSQEGTLSNDVSFKLSENDGQHLIIWRGPNVLEVDYSGAASLAEHLELYASAISKEGNK